MHFRHNAIARPTHFRSAVFRFFLKSQLRIITYRTFATQNLPCIENAEMGKDKVTFNLKTPKGTKDCENGFLLAKPGVKVHIDI